MAKKAGYNAYARARAPKARLAPLIKVLLTMCALVFAAIAVMFVMIFLDRGRDGREAQAAAFASAEAGPADPQLLGRWIEERYGTVIAFFGDGTADSFHAFTGSTRPARYAIIDGRLMLSGYGVDAAFIYEVDGSELTLTAGEGGFAFEELSVQEGEAMVFYELIAWIEEDSGVPIPPDARAELSEIVLNGASMPEIIEFIEGIGPE